MYFAPSYCRKKGIIFECISNDLIEFHLVFCFDKCNTNNYVNNQKKNIWSCGRVSWIVIVLYLTLCKIFTVNAAVPLCDVVAATNIHSQSGYSQWSCTTAGVTSTAPCTSPVWPGIICSGSNMVSISLKNIGLPGTVLLFETLTFVS